MNSQSEKSDADQVSDHYLVLARKYRPENFDDLIGQESMVKTLRNAFATGRIAQAYMLTGVRGVGKTTTARILARGLNYRSDQIDSPSADFEGYGLHCRDILLSSHVDVQEIDAASHTGVDHIRELIESTRYAPVLARYKVYIIDEVHMLSISSFNALLKTLEEPPEHVKFIFATTEIHKVPVTILSRCQRFDLRRISTDDLVDHFAAIVKKEKVAVSRQALALIAQLAEGSVRDGLSILDQVIAQGARTAKEGGNKKSEALEAADIRDLLGLVDRTQLLDLVETVLHGKAGETVAQLDVLYKNGAEPARVLSEIAEIIGYLTRARVAGSFSDPALDENFASRIEKLSGDLSVPALSRAWQMLIKGIEEVKQAPDQLTAVMMVLVRVTYTADLPDPSDLVRILEAPDKPQDPSQAPPPQGRQPVGSTSPNNRTGYNPQEDMASDQTFCDKVDVSGNNVQLHSFEDLLALCRDKKAMMLAMTIENDMYPVSFDPCRITMQLGEEAKHGFANDLKNRLLEWTGQNWQIIIVREGGLPSLGEVKRQQEERELAEVEKDPLVQAVKKQFKNARITNIRHLDEQDRDDTNSNRDGKIAIGEE